MAATRLIQITDLHLGASVDERLAGVNTYNSFLSVLEQVEANGDGSYPFLLTGDLAGASEPGAYRLLNDLLVQRQQKSWWLPGNHDDLAIMGEFLRDYPRQRIVELDGWAIILLNSSQPNTPVGHLAESELAFAARALHKMRGKHVMIAMHHTPVELGSQWLDTQRIGNQDQLYQLLVDHGNVRAVVTGHVHQAFDGLWHDIPLFCTPSSCIQFKQGSDMFALSELPPGYRWFNLHSNGKLETGLELVSDYAQLADQNCVGY